MPYTSVLCQRIGGLEFTRVNCQRDVARCTAESTGTRRRPNWRNVVAPGFAVARLPRECRKGSCFETGTSATEHISLRASLPRSKTQETQLLLETQRERQQRHRARQTAEEARARRATLPRNSATEHAWLLRRRATLPRKSATEYTLLQRRRTSATEHGGMF